MEDGWVEWVGAGWTTRGVDAEWMAGGGRRRGWWMDGMDGRSIVLVVDGGKWLSSGRRIGGAQWVGGRWRGVHLLRVVMRW